jgi:hypothetical protein
MTVVRVVRFNAGTGNTTDYTRAVQQTAMALTGHVHGVVAFEVRGYMYLHVPKLPTVYSSTDTCGPFHF